MSTICGWLVTATVGNVERDWSKVFFGLDQDQQFTLLLVGLGCATAIIISAIGMITGMVGAMHRRRMEAEMKREMLDRGLAVDEITRIVECSTPKDALERWITSWSKKN